MEPDNQFSATAYLIGEHARAAMLWNLLDGRAYTAGELALSANISPQSASNHLNKLIKADFLKVEKQGKHRYYRFAREEVAFAIESIANLMPYKKASGFQKRFVNGDIQYARTCYDHLAGKIAVDLTQALIKQKILKPDGNNFLVSSKGEAWFEMIGLNVNELKNSKRHFAKACLDWTERKHHLAGALGAALLNQMLSFNWIRKKANSRIVILTAKGETELSKLGVSF
ncbi:MAG TPA: winged helix-turn-helix domain-containing protein [Chitinophagaceae bacterium]|nr:winged helix-turn-helix domain-containing protein [Chitinophagaceae bacterium]